MKPLILLLACLSLTASADSITFFELGSFKPEAMAGSGMNGGKIEYVRTGMTTGHLTASATSFFYTNPAGTITFNAASPNLVFKIDVDLLINVDGTLAGFEGSSANNTLLIKGTDGGVIFQSAKLQALSFAPGFAGWKMVWRKDGGNSDVMNAPYPAFGAILTPTSSTPSFASNFTQGATIDVFMTPVPKTALAGCALFALALLRPRQARLALAR